jgi:hypothetical protein
LAGRFHPNPWGSEAFCEPAIVPPVTVEQKINSDSILSVEVACEQCPSASEPPGINVFIEHPTPVRTHNKTTLGGLLFAGFAKGGRFSTIFIHADRFSAAHLPI